MPSISLVKTGTYVDNTPVGTYNAGDQITYTFTVTNTGNVPLTNVTIADPKVTVVGGPIATLAAGATNSNTFTATYTLTQADITAGSFTNTATATGTYNGQPYTATDSDTKTFVMPSISLVKTGNYVDNAPMGTYNAGDQITYTFTVTNTGNVPLTNVTIADPKVTVVGGPIATLAAGATNSNTFTATYTLTQADITAGSFTNTATVTGKYNGQDYTATDSDTKTFVMPSISLIKTGTYVDNTPVGTYNAGDQITYTFTVTNTGNVPLTNVTIADPKVTVVGGPIATLAAGATNSNTFTATYTLTQADITAGSFTNTATVKGTYNGQDYTATDSDTQNFVMPSISLIKTGTYVDNAPVGTYNAGDQITYTFTVTNTGNVPLTNVTIADPKVTVSGGPIATLAVGATNSNTFSATYTLTQADITAGSFTNTATVKGTYNGQDYTATDSDTKTFVMPSISLVKTGTYVDNTPVGTYNAGDQITYTFTVTNTGNVPLTNVTIADPKVTVVGGPIATLAVGATNSNTFTATYTLTQADITAGSFTNTATVTGTYNGQDYTATDSDTKTFVMPSISLIKTGTYVDNTPVGTYNAGDQITYTFTVTNTGNVPLTNVTIADPKVNVSGGPIATLAVGATNSNTFTATYTLTQADITAGSFTNTATATGTYNNQPYTGSDSDTQNFPRPSISLVKTGTYVDNAPVGTYNAGDQITYAFTVTNTGNVPLTNVTITDPKVTVVGGPIATLAAGATNSSTFTATYTLTQADITAGSFTNTATATGTYNNQPYTGSDSDTQNFPMPSISLIKTGTYVDNAPVGTYNAGDQITYTFTVTNTGNVPLTNVTITDPKVTVVGGPIATLAAGATNSNTFTATYTLTQADITAGSFTNTATVTGTHNGQTYTATDSDTKTFVMPSISLIKTGTYVDNAPVGTYNAGDQITYTFTVTNTGNVPLTNVTITDPKVTVVGGPIATLAVGATNSNTFTATYTLTQADITAGSFTNTATVTGTYNNQPYTDTDSDTKTFVMPSISLIKTGTYVDNSPVGTYNAGDQITYTFTVTNTGNVPLTNVTIADPKVTVVGGPIATLAVGATNSNTFTATYTLTQADITAGSFTNTATATGTYNNQPYTATDSDTKTFVMPSISLIKTGTYVDNAPVGTYNAGDQITYTFTVTNTGNVPLTNVTISDPKVTVVGGPIATLAAGATNSNTFTATYTLTQADITAGSFTNTATATGTYNNQPYTATDSDTQNFPRPSISLVKTGTYVDNTPVGTYNAGDQITYTFTVTNTGNVPLTNVTIADPKVTVSGGPIATLAAGATNSNTFTATYTLTQADITAGSFTNTATVAGTYNGQSYTATDSDTQNFPRPSISLVKTGTYVDNAPVGTYNAGDQITYTFTVTNTGNVPLTNVTITDPKVTVVGGPIATLAAGATNSNTFTATYTLTQVDITAGSFTNTATATGTYNNQPYTATDSDTQNFPRPSISLVKTGTYVDNAPVGTYNAGDQITYTFTVTNTGNVPLTNVTITDPKVTVVGGPIATLAAGATNSNTFTATYTLTQADITAGSFTNTATATGTYNGQDYTATDSDTQNFPMPSVSLTKTADKEQFLNVGEVITYTIKVTNTGNVTLQNISIKDPLTGLEQIIISMIPGAEVILETTYSIRQEDINRGSLTNTAVATYVFDGIEYTETVSVVTITESNPELKVNKTADKTQFGQAGVTITYTIEVINTGNVSLINVKVTDPLAGLNVTLSAMPPGSREAFTVTYVTTLADLDRGYVLNKVTAEGQDSAGTKLKDEAEVTVNGIQSPAIEVTKEALLLSDQASLGELVTYRITVKNTGNITLRDVRIRDPLTGLDRLIGILIPGASEILFTEYTVTITDETAGRIINTATAEGTAPKGDKVTDTDSVTTNVQSCEMVIPNGFSPNGDGIQDFWRITCIEKYPDARIEVYNRWGNLVYQKNNYGNIDVHGPTDAWWDGYSTNKWTLGSDKLPSGTYFYILDLGDGSKPLNGFIFLNR
jgi:gliding motility-associated-like protein/uncharacterized repeat protein (TIGR01451 family)